MSIIIQSSSAFTFIIIIFVIILIGICAYYFSGKQVIIRTLSKIPNKPIGSLKTNELSKVTGKALHVKEPLIAPLSKRKCVFYTIKIEKKVSSGKSSHWKTIVEDEKMQEFFLDNNGEYVIIQPTLNPKNFISYLVTDKEASSGTFNDPTPEFESLLRSYNIESTGSLFGFNKRLRYKEGIIEIGEKITVAGIARWKNLDETIAEYPYSKIASLESKDKQKLIITDVPEVVNQKRQR